jgi:predicted GTPase
MRSESEWRSSTGIAHIGMYANSSSSSLFDSDPDDEELRSYFDCTTKGCDVFRILLVGKSGSGKSTLVSEVFDFDLDDANVQHFSVSAA